VFLALVATVGDDRAALVTAGVVALLLPGARAIARGTATFGRATRGIGTVALAALLAIGATFWIGANSASATWFGPLKSHGPRHSNEVALTFDDGPNATTTLAVAHILDRFHTKGTFFEVGKAVAQRPDISRALVRDGQLLGNHSYHHDYWRWLDPLYPELTRTQSVIERDAGVCPAFYRPPHGQHTPFLAHVVDEHHMTMVTWDVSTSDWTTTDAAAVARHILHKVRPGSIVDLHDGLDGHVNVDRRVVARALPAILEGLRARGLRPVRLDVLLGRPGYTRDCS
jgi:peptidoglycan/xylan/chitin deacetylase (PgdA/CDA1 family)